MSLYPVLLGMAAVLLSVASASLASVSTDFTLSTPLSEQNFPPKLRGAEPDKEAEDRAIPPVPVVSALAKSNVLTAITKLKGFSKFKHLSLESIDAMEHFFTSSAYKYWSSKVPHAEMCSFLKEIFTEKGAAYIITIYPNKVGREVVEAQYEAWIRAGIAPSDLLDRLGLDRWSMINQCIRYVYSLYYMSKFDKSFMKQTHIEEYKKYRVKEFYEKY